MGRFGAMRVSFVLVILALVFLGMKIPSCMSQAAVGPELMGKFEAQINEEIADQACVKEGPFPFSSRIGRTSEATSYVSYKCEKCDVLYQAGWLSKEVV